MKKYPLTTEGVEKKQNELFKLDDAHLQKVAIEISQDFKTWIFNSFELTKE